MFTSNCLLIRSDFLVERLAFSESWRDAKEIKEIREFKDVKDKRLRLLQQLRATCCLRTRTASLRSHTVALRSPLTSAQRFRSPLTSHL